MNEIRYMISDASKKLHVEAHVLRYWEDELGMDIPRTELGHRYYTDNHLLIFERVKKLKEAGYLLKAIKLIMPKLGALDEDEFTFISLVAEEMNRMAAEICGEAAAADTGEAASASADVRQANRTAADTADRTADSSAADNAMTDKEQEISAAGSPAEGDIRLQAADRQISETCTETDTERQESPDAQLPSNVIPMNRTPSELSHEEKLQQFQTVMTNAVSGAMQQQAQQFGALLSDQVSAKLLTEINYLLRLRQEQEEMHFQQLDETLRSHQKALQEAAAGRAPGRRKKRR